MAMSVARLNEPAVVSTMRRLTQGPAMKGYQNFRGGTQEQMTTISTLRYKRTLITNRAIAVQKKASRVPRGTKMRFHSSRIAALANPIDAV